MSRKPPANNPPKSASPSRKTPAKKATPKAEPAPIVHVAGGSAHDAIDAREARLGLTLNVTRAQLADPAFDVKKAVDEAMAPGMVDFLDDLILRHAGTVDRPPTDPRPAIVDEAGREWVRSRPREVTPESAHPGGRAF